MKLKKAIPISELKIKSDDEIEQDRARVLFEDIQKRGNNGGALTQHEKKFFHECLSVSRRDDGSPKDYGFCEDYVFNISKLTILN